MSKKNKNSKNKASVQPKNKNLNRKPVLKEKETETILFSENNKNKKVSIKNNNDNSTKSMSYKENQIKNFFKLFHKKSKFIYDAPQNELSKALEEIDRPILIKKKKKPIDFIRYGLIAVFAAAFIISGTEVVQSAIYYVKGQILYSSLEDIWNEEEIYVNDGIHLTKSAHCDPSIDALTAANSTDKDLNFSGSSSSTKETREVIVARINKIRALNEDVYGWIKIDDIDISYPLVQSYNNNFYLRRDFYRNELNAGCIFVDYRNSQNLGANRNTVIYGHNMNDGSMFAGLHKFSKKSVFDSTKIVITTLDGIFTYEVFSVHRPYERSDYFNTDFATDEEFADWLKRMKEQSIFSKDIELLPTDKVITLSTCLDTIAYSSYRYAIHAKLISVVK